MKVILDPAIVIHRGGEVKIGNVYSNPKFRYWRVVVGIIIKPVGSGQRWNNVVCIHIDIDGDIVGASCLPTRYMSEHQDLVGHVKQMPSMKIEWLRK
jgi:hypothetical protein